VNNLGLSAVLPHDVENRILFERRAVSAGGSNERSDRFLTEDEARPAN
jgi:hypothetical protein